MRAYAIGQHQLLSHLYRAGQQRLTGALVLHCSGGSAAMPMRDGRWIGGTRTRLATLTVNGPAVLELLQGPSWCPPSRRLGELDVVTAIEAHLAKIVEPHLTLHKFTQPLHATSEMRDYPRGKLPRLIGQLGEKDLRNLPLLCGSLYLLEALAPVCTRGAWNTLGLLPHGGKTNVKAHIRALRRIAHPDLGRLSPNAAQTAMANISAAEQALTSDNPALLSARQPVGL